MNVFILLRYLRHGQDTDADPAPENRHVIFLINDLKRFLDEVQLSYNMLNERAGGQ
jgi:hypothetical protein